VGYDMYLAAPTAADQARKKAHDQAFDQAIWVRNSFSNQSVTQRFPQLRHPVSVLGPDQTSWPDYGWDWSKLTEEDRTAFGQAEEQLRREDAAFRAKSDELQAAVDRATEFDDPTYFRLNIWGMAQYCELMELLGMLNESEPPEFPDHDFYEIPSVTSPEGYEEDDENSAAFKAYKAALDRATNFLSPEPGIPVAKFGSNDGWLVTPAECESALAIWEAFSTKTKIAVREFAERRFGEGEPAETIEEQRSLQAAVLIDQTIKADQPAVTYVSDPANDWDRWLDFFARAQETGGFNVW
jgi:hypothetical protein